MVEGTEGEEGREAKLTADHLMREQDSTSSGLTFVLECQDDRLPLLEGVNGMLYC